MKGLLSTLLVFIGLNAWCQNEVWETLPANPNNTGLNYDFEMIDGKVYLCYYRNISGTDELAIDLYNPATSTWVFLDAYAFAAPFNKIITEKQSNKLVICTYSNTDFNFLKFDDATQKLTVLAPPFTQASINDNWLFHAGKNPDEYYVLYTVGTGPSEVHVIEYDAGGNSWTHNQENAASNLSIATLRMISDDTKVYLGVYSTKVRMTFFNKGSVGTMFAYDGGATGELFADGSPWVNRRWLFTGNKNNAPWFYGTSDINNNSYESRMNGTTININTSTDPVTDYNLDSNNVIGESSPSHAFILSNFSKNGLGNPNEKLQVIRRDIAAGAVVWDTLATELQPIGTALVAQSVRMSVDNNGAHLAAGYTPLAGSNEIRVSNHVPTLVGGSNIANSGLCPGDLNEIYPLVMILDDDYDQVRILSAVSVNATTSAINVIPAGTINGISKFKIFGIPTASSDQIELTFTDGYGIYTVQLASFSGNTSPINLQFISDPVLICSNMRQVDLSTLVNYYDQGTFRLNGQELSGTVIDASKLVLTTGTLRYKLNVNGCYVSTQANYNIVAPPTVSTSASPSDCGLNSGSASAIITPGAASGYSYYWSTGEQTLSIANLSPGAYYIHVKDDNGCKATGLASVDINSISVTSVVNNPTCAGVKNGSIALTVSGTTNYQVVWSNGVFGDNVNNLKAGNYEFTLYDGSGCEYKQSFQLTAPPPLTNSFTSIKPDCGASNGSIQATVSGGTPNYNLLWSTGDNTPMITGQAQGFYLLTITDANGCVLKDSLNLNERFAAQISDSVILADCNFNNGGIDATITPDALGDPIQSIQWDNGSTTEDIYNLPAGTYQVSVLTTANCLSQKSIRVGTRAPFRNDICVVSVDDATTTNLVIWEKAQFENVSHYNIYREDADAGLYAWVDTVQYSSLSVFNDVIASPLQRSWRYRISAVNACGVEGPLSPPHKTLHLNTIQEVTPGVIGVYWDDYEGFVAAEYVVHRYTDQSGWVNLTPTVPFGNPTKFLDTPPAGETGLDYYVSLSLNEPCTATFKAQDFNTSRSNKEKGVFNPGTGTGNSNNELTQISGPNGLLKAMPNPFDEHIQIQVEGDASCWVEVRDVQGKLLKRIWCKNGQSTIDSGDLDHGIYFISASIQGINYTLKLIK